MREQFIKKIYFEKFPAGHCEFEISCDRPVAWSSVFLCHGKISPCRQEKHHVYKNIVTLFCRKLCLVCGLFTVFRWQKNQIVIVEVSFCRGKIYLMKEIKFVNMGHFSFFFVISWYSQAILVKTIVGAGAC